MPKIVVTQQLADTIKTLRLQNNIPAKALASELGKSPSYITKLEKGDIKSLSQDDLLHILDFVMKGQETYEQRLDSIFRTLSIRYTPQEIEREIWLLNFDTVERNIPIPQDFVANLNQRIKDNSISIAYLVSRINANEEIPLQLAGNDEQYNVWINTNINGHNHNYIKMRVSEEQVDGILSCRVTSASYVLVLAVTLYITKIEKYGDIRELSYSQSQELIELAISQLNHYKFYSLVEKSKIEKKITSEDERQSLLSSFDLKNLEIVNGLLDNFRVMSSIDMEKANRQLGQFLENLEWDVAFTMRIISLNFPEIGKTSYTIKKKIIEEIGDILLKYKEIPETEKMLETYD